VEQGRLRKNILMYKIEKIDIKDYKEIINLWKNTDGVGLSGKRVAKRRNQENIFSCI